MHILIDLQPLQGGSRYRGIGRYTYALVSQMLRSSNGHRFTFLVNDLLGDSAELVTRFEGLIQVDQLAHFTASGPVCEGQRANVIRYRAAEAVYEALVADIDPTVFLIPSLFEGVADETVISIGQYTKKVPVAVVLYDFIPYVDPAQHIGSVGARAWYARRMDALLSADLCLAISAHTAREISAHFPLDAPKTVAIMAGTSDIFAPPLPQAERPSPLLRRWPISRPYIMHSGTLEPRKNFHGLIEAFSQLPKVLRKRHQLVLVGTGSKGWVMHLNELVQRYGLASDEVVFTGHVTDAELVALYQECHLFVFPSFEEGFGFPPLEALACGAVVIGSNTTSVPEVIGRADALFDPHSVDAILTLMHRGLVDRAFRKSFEETRRQQTEKLNWVTTTKIALDAIENLGDRSQAR